MISFLLCLAILIGGYFVYGKIVDNTFGPDDRETPAVRINDGVDYVVMPQWKLFLVQLLNIAGLGPIFGAVLGELLNGRRDAGKAILVGIGSFLSFVVGTGIKLAAAIGMFVHVTADTYPAVRDWFAPHF